MEALLGSRKVGDFMTRELISVKINFKVFEVISILAQKEVSGLIVVDNAGEVVGVISAMDIFKLFSGERKANVNYTAEEVMTPYTITISPGDDLFEAGRLMLENGIHRLVVTESPTRKRPLGIISSSDIIKEIEKMV